MMSTETFTLTSAVAAEAAGRVSARHPARSCPRRSPTKPRIVPWLGYKIDHAVRAAALAAGADISIGQQVQAEIEFRMKRERPLFIHIEQLQDLVEETLMEIGHGKVALVYAKYRAKRAALRELETEQFSEELGQLELASWEQLTDIRARISFARIGLELTLAEDELIARLLRSVSHEPHARGAAGHHHPQRQEPPRRRCRLAASSRAAFSSPISTRRRCRGRSPTASAA